MIELRGELFTKLLEPQVDRRRRRGGGKDAKRRVVELEPARRLRRLDDVRLDLDDRFGMEIRRLVGDHLDDAGPVADEQERKLREASLLLQPARDPDALAGMGRELSDVNALHDGTSFAFRLEVRAGGGPAVPPHFAAAGDGLLSS
jgi:hypothetical protein